MKFMKLGSKPDCFQTDGDNVWYVATDLATDLTITVGEVKFYLHKFPLLSKSSRMQKLIATTNEGTSNEIHIHDIPGGPTAFETCAKFCYGMTVTLNAYNAFAVRSASEYLEMYETIEKGNLIYKIDVFLNSSLFRSWKDSIIFLRSTKSSHVHRSDLLKVNGQCLDSIASKASVDTDKVEWSYTYSRKKLLLPNGTDIRKLQTVPNDWWVEDICELEVDLYRQVIEKIKSIGKISSEVIGESLFAYVLKKIPGIGNGTIACLENTVMNRNLVETVICLLPTEKRSVSCSFLLILLKSVILLECGENEKSELIKRIGKQLDEATVSDILIRAPEGEYNVDLAKTLLEEFIAYNGQNEFLDTRNDSSKAMVTKLIDGYLAEIARDPDLPLSKFVDLSEMVSRFPRGSHDGVYRAVDMYLKGHPRVSKSDRKRICRLIDCRNLSSEACMHAVQNERLPLRVVVQILFFERARATSSGGSNESSRTTTTNTENDWDEVASVERLKALKGELNKIGGDGKVSGNRVKGLVMPKMFARLWSGNERNSDISTSVTSDETKSTSGRHSVS